MESDAVPVIIPLLNPNEPEAKLVSLGVQEGQFVEKGDLLCTLETTKSTADVIAEVDGYIIALALSVGQNVPAGTQLCYLAEAEDWESLETEIEPSQDTKEKTFQDAAADLPSGLRISQPALKLAQLYNLDLNLLPKGPLVTENIVREFAEEPVHFDISKSEFDAIGIVIYGGGGHGKSVIELVRSLGTYQIRGIIDDGLNPGDTVMDVPVLGGKEILPELYEAGVRLATNAVGGIGDITSRVMVFQHLIDAGFVSPALIHPSAVVEPSSFISPGVQIFPNAYIGSEVKLGFGVIVNTGAVVSHECNLDDFANISPGALLAGGVQVGSKSLIGMGVTINLGVKIGNNARVGNSATVNSDIPPDGMVKSGSTWPE
jgi:acetyltransferase EpsM